MLHVRYSKGMNLKQKIRFCAEQPFTSRRSEKANTALEQLSHQPPNHPHACEHNVLHATQF